METHTKVTRRLSLLLALAASLVSVSAAGFETGGPETPTHFIYHGKPHRGIYETCFALMRATARARIAAIGDSLRTDIAGANGAGIDGIFITGGLQGEALGVDEEGNAEPARLAAFCAAAGQIPAAALAALRW